MSSTVLSETQVLVKAEPCDLQYFAVQSNISVTLLILALHDFIKIIFNIYKPTAVDTRSFKSFFKFSLKIKP